MSFNLSRPEYSEAGHAAAGNDAFLNCSARRMHGVFDASLLSFSSVRSRAYLNHRNAAYQLRQPFLKLSPS